MTSQAKVLIQLINKNNITSVAEIGVCKGLTSLAILENCPGIKEYYCIDPWTNQVYNGEEGKNRDKLLSTWDQATWDDCYYATIGRLFNFRDKVCIFRLTSKEAVIKITKNIDLVFIDAAHDYESVKEDIKLWLPKTNRFLTGHDLCTQFPGVEQAVREAFTNDFSIEDTVWIYNIKNSKRDLTIITEAPPGWALLQHARVVEKCLESKFNISYQYWDGNIIYPKNGLIYITDILAAEILNYPKESIITGTHDNKELIRFDQLITNGKNITDQEALDIRKGYKVSQRTIDYLKQYAGFYCMNKIAQEMLDSQFPMIHHAVDPSIYYNQYHNNRPVNKLNVAWVGNSLREPEKKNINLMLKILSKMNDYPYNTMFNIDIKAIVSLNNKGLSVEVMPVFYTNIDILITTSVDEGGPLPPLEAAACGVINVSTPCGHMSEFIEDGYNGYIVEPNVNAFLNKLQDIYRLRSSNYMSLVKNSVFSAWKIADVKESWLNFFARVV